MHGRVEIDHRPLAAALLILSLGLVTNALFRREAGPRLEQSYSNLRFVERPSLARALDHYPRVWPPLYPLLLRAWVRGMRAPAPLLNETLFLATLPLLWLACRDVARAPHAAAALLFWSVAHFNHADFYQLTADALVTPLMLALQLALVRYARQASPARLLAVSIVTAGLLTARYFSLFAVLPVALLVIASAPGLDARRRSWHALGLGLACLPAFFWMAQTWLRTGYWTGADRQAARHLPAYLAYWSRLETPVGNLYCWSKSLFIDLFSVREHAALAYVTTRYEAAPLEWLMLGVAVVCAALALPTLRQGPAASLSERVALLLFGAHNAMLIVVWSFGNNDPLYSRYLWPSYALLVILAAAAYARVRERWPLRPWPALPFRLLLALLLVVHLQRSVLAPKEPVGLYVDPEAETLEP